MKRIAAIVLVLSAVVGMSSRDAWPAKKSCQPFEELRMALERNETDGDTEVVLFAQGQDEGLRSLVITGPGGKQVAEVRGSKRGVGLREFLLESAEPPDLDLVLRSFPEGTYQVRGRTVGGGCLAGSVVLSHTIAPATQLLTPAEDEVVAVDELVLSWTAVPGAVLYIVEIQNEDLGNEHTLQILPPTTSVAIPAALLVPGSAYQWGVAVQAADGNVTAVESTFSTAP